MNWVNFLTVIALGTMLLSGALFMIWGENKDVSKVYKITTIALTTIAILSGALAAGLA